MLCCIDIEANSLTKPDKIWVIVCKDIDTGKIEVFRNVHEDSTKFTNFLRSVKTLVGHNILGYDLPVLKHLNIFSDWVDKYAIVDTLITSKMVNYSRPNGHSIEAYGEEFGLPKLENKATSFFSKWSQELEDYCIRDVEICSKIYSCYKLDLADAAFTRARLREQRFQLVVNDLHDNGFCFNRDSARRLLEDINKELGVVDKEIHDAFPPTQVLVKTFTPRATKFGTISKTSIPRINWDKIHTYSIGETYPVYTTRTFNPDSHKQRIEVLHEAGWRPIEKTTGHKEAERELNRIKYREGLDSEVAKGLVKKLEHFKKYGWVISEENLDTLPVSAPAPARSLAKHILLESRRRKLVEWIDLVKEDGRIHGKFIGIGAWTHRMAHQEPNMANIPRDDKAYGKEFRKLWRAPRRRLLVGVDAEGIQFRIFAHYVDNKELTNAIVSGSKADKTDPHSFNQRILGSVCKSRQAAKRFIYSLFLGAGINKLSEILECSKEEAEEGLSRILNQYPAFERLREDVIPHDASKGYFISLEGAKVPIPGDTFSQRKHLCMSGYLQHGEKLCISGATNRFVDKLSKYKAFLVDIVHDEWQIEAPNNMDTCVEIGNLVCQALVDTGNDLGLKCPLAGSFYNEDARDYTIGIDWLVTH